MGGLSLGSFLSSRPQYPWCCLSVWRLGRFSVTMLWVDSASFLCPSFPISCVLFVRLACGRLRPRCLGSWGVLPCPVRGLAGHVGPDVLRSSDCGILLSLVLLPSTTLSRLFHVPCPSGSGVRLPYRLPCLRHREFLPASVRGLSAADNLFTCGVCGFSLSGVGRYHLLQASRSSFSLRSPQYIVAVASRSSSTSSSFLGRLSSPRRSPIRVAVHHPLLPLALLSGCGFTLPLPLRPCCPLARRLAGFEVVSLTWLFFLMSVLGFFLFLVPSRDAVTCAWCLYSCGFSCYPLLPDCTYCTWRV